MTRSTAKAIWELIDGDTQRQIFVNYKDGGENRGRVISLDDEAMVLQDESSALLTIALPDILSVEVIDPHH